MKKLNLKQWVGTALAIGALLHIIPFTSKLIPSWVLPSLLIIGALVLVFSKKNEK